MNPNDSMMHDEEDEDGDLSEAEILEKHRQRYEGMRAAMEARRSELEAQGVDVDAELAEMQAAWDEYAGAQHEVDEIEETYLHKVADVADVRVRLLKLYRDGMAAWEEALAAAPEGSTQRVEVWEGFTAWKARMRAMVQARLAATTEEGMARDTYREVLKMLEA